MTRARLSDGHLLWDCPGCQTLHGVRVHRYENGPTKNGSWLWDGSLNMPTLSPSVLVRWKDSHGQEHRCHCFITSGYANFLDDCTHEMTGKVVLIPVEEP